jgi:DNA mismatch repair protein MutS
VRGSDLRHIERIDADAPDALVLDETTKRNLEVFAPSAGGPPERRRGHGRLTLTAPARRLRAWLDRPLVDARRIGERLDAVEELLKSGSVREELRRRLKGASDLERLLGKAACGKAGPRDLTALQVTLERLPGIRDTLAVTGQ